MTYKESGEPYFVTILLNVLLNLQSEFSEAKLPVIRRLRILNHSVVRRTEEIRNRKPLRRRIRNNAVFHTLVNVIAPSLK